MGIQERNFISNSRPTPDARYLAQDEPFMIDSVSSAIRAYREQLRNAGVNTTDIQTTVTNQILGLMNAERRPYILDALQTVTGTLPIQNQISEGKPTLPEPPTWAARESTEQFMVQGLEHELTPTPWKQMTKKGIVKGPGRYSSKR